MVRRQTIEIKSVSLQQSLSKLKQRGVDLVKDSTGLEAGLDCRPGRFAAAQGRQSHPASRPVSSLTRSTPLCFSLARLVLRPPFLFYVLLPDHKKVISLCKQKVHRKFSMFQCRFHQTLMIDNKMTSKPKNGFNYRPSRGVDFCTRPVNGWPITLWHYFPPTI